MSRCGNGTSRLFSCARLCRAGRTKATAFMWRDWPDCRRKSWNARRTFCSISRDPMAPWHNRKRSKDRQRKLRKRKNGKWICAESPKNRRTSWKRRYLFALTTDGYEIMIPRRRVNYGDQNRERTERNTAQSLAQSDRGDRAAQFWLRHFAFAGNFETGAGVLDGPAIAAADRSHQEQIGQEKPFQHLDRADRGHESSARDKKRSKARSGNDRKDIGGRAIPSPGESGIEGSGGGGGLAGG